MSSTSDEEQLSNFFSYTMGQLFSNPEQANEVPAARVTPSQAPSETIPPRPVSYTMGQSRSTSLKANEVPAARVTPTRYPSETIPPRPACTMGQPWWSPSLEANEVPAARVTPTQTPSETIPPRPAYTVEPWSTSLKANEVPVARVTPTQTPSKPNPPGCQALGKSPATSQSTVEPHTSSPIPLKPTGELSNKKNTSEPVLPLQFTSNQSSKSIVPHAAHRVSDLTDRKFADGLESLDKEEKSLRVFSPPTVSYYVPREKAPPKTRDATKKTLKFHERIGRVSESKLSSAPDVEQFKTLLNRWRSIDNLHNIDKLKAVQHLQLPILMNLKLVELRSSFTELVSGFEDFDSCFTVFEVLVDVCSSKFEFHQIEVMKEIASPCFMKKLLFVVDGMLIVDQPSKEKFRIFIAYMVDLYARIFICMDVLVTDGLAEDLIKVIERCQKLEEVWLEDTYCSDNLDKLLMIINARDTLIRANSCYPYNILQEESIEKNIIDGPYRDFDQYISIHYRLLKEDFQNSLRLGMIDTMRNYGRNKKKSFHLTLYPHVELKTVLNKNGLSYQIHFPTNSIPSDLNILTGALMILSPLVSPKNPVPFEYYYLVRAESSRGSDKGFFNVSMIFGPTNFFTSIDLMLVVPRQFFEPYFRVMDVLRSLDSGNYPFLRYILDLNKDVFPPAYMKEDTQLKIGDRICSLWDDGSWPSPEEIKLNPDQLEGLKIAFRNELAIIQGPPGTGKTMLTKTIMNILIDNKNLWSHTNNGGFILVACAKNQSLDQLLNKLIESGRKVLRIGTQSKEESLDEYNLYTLKCHWTDKIYFEMRDSINREQSEIISKLRHLIGFISLLENVQGLINIAHISTILCLDEDNSKYLMENYEDWLLPPELKNSLLTIGERKHKPTDEIKQYCYSLQEIRDEIAALDADSNSETSASLTSEDLNLIALLGEKLEFLEDELNKLNKPLPLHDELKLLHLKDSFSTLENQPRIKDLSLEKRWLLYRVWINALRDRISNDIPSLIGRSQDLNFRSSEIQDILNMRKIANCDADVIGMTTTATAKFHKILECLQPKIVVMEEAAEVMEAHTIAAISQYCQHLILVGDHQQLRPLTSSHLIGKHAHLEVSLYERLVRNGHPHCTLNTQYRMRPEISSLIAPAIYKDLTNGSSVYEYPHVRGVTRDVFFMDHDVQEEEVQETKSNTYEAQFLLALCSYLLKQGYEHHQVIILTTYSGQEKYFSQVKSKYPTLADIRIATVDSFQGQEADIVLLSLVRSNAEGNIGFLAQRNRINVALSRAKMGLYILGNLKNLIAKGGLWRDVQDVLSRNGAIGTSLPLKCEVHGKITLVATARDFEPLKNGGCSKICCVELECEHKCIHQCHVLDRDHKDIYKCSNICAKKMDCSHTCLRVCHKQDEKISCFCKRCSPNSACDMVMKCDHICKRAAHLEDMDHNGKFICEKLCDTPLRCGHICTSPCHIEDSDHKTKFKCPILCEGTFSCGHQCRYVLKDKHGCSDHGQCLTYCLTVMSCGHKCKKFCHSKDLGNESSHYCEHCKKLSALDTSSANQVLNPTVSELESTTSTSTCVHGTPNTAKCKMKCGFELKCGHICKKMCHLGQSSHNKICKQPCNTLLQCGHICTEICHFRNLSKPEKSSWCETCRTTNTGRCVHGSCHNEICMMRMSSTNPRRFFEFPLNPTVSELESTTSTGTCVHGTANTAKCKKKCGFKLKCGHICEKKCHLDPSCHNKVCKRQCNIVLQCGHICTERCHFTNLSEHEKSSWCKKCQDLSSANQVLNTTVSKQESTTSTGTCVHGTPNKTECKMMCGFKLKCGHICEKKCHLDSSCHNEICERQCNIVLQCGHICTERCHFTFLNLHYLSAWCKKCQDLSSANQVLNTTVSKQESTTSTGTCVHGTPNKTECKMMCGFKLKCGHICEMKCHLDSSCHNEICKRQCNIVLQCGHICTERCHFTFLNLHYLAAWCKQCHRLSSANQVLNTTVSKQGGTTSTGTCVHGTPNKTECKMTCGFEFECGHMCRKKCYRCPSRHNKICMKKCNILLQCGHICKERCHFTNLSKHEKSSWCKLCSRLLSANQVLSTTVLEPESTASTGTCVHGTPNTAKCKMKCGFTLKCGHICEKRCHLDPSCHYKICMKRCNTLLQCGHICKERCHFTNLSKHEESSWCIQCPRLSSANQVLNTTVSVPESTTSTGTCVHGTPNTAKCKMKCGFKLKCGHICGKRCHRDPSRHYKICKRLCNTSLQCGHICKERCHFTNLSKHEKSSWCIQCPRLSSANRVLNTTVSVPESTTSTGTCVHGTPNTAKCKMTCGFKLKCGHICEKLCHLDPSVHDEYNICSWMYMKKLQCGHILTEQCHLVNLSDRENSPRCKICLQ